MSPAGAAEVVRPPNEPNDGSSVVDGSAAIIDHRAAVVDDVGVEAGVGSAKAGPSGAKAASTGAAVVDRVNEAAERAAIAGGAWPKAR